MMMPPATKEKLNWLLLLFRIPASRKAERVAVWRKLKRSGAIQLTTSTYLLPDLPGRDEAFQWLAKEIRDAGGDATLVRARKIEGFSNEKLIELFNSAREKEYAVLNEALRAASKGKKAKTDVNDVEVERFRKRYREIREMDFFDAPRAANTQMLLQKFERPLGTKSSSSRVDPGDYR